MPRWPWTRPVPDLDEEQARDEIAAHLALRVEENLARGLTPDEARREAERRMGAIDRAARQSAHIRRSQSSLPRALLVDIRHAAKAALRARFATAAGILVAAIGLGTVGAARTLARALLHTPPAGVVQPYQLRSALEGLLYPESSTPRLRFLSYKAFQSIAAAAPEAHPFAWGARDLQVIWNGTGRVVPAAMVTGGYFGTLGLDAHAGRLLGPADSRERHTAAVLSLRFARALAHEPRALIGGTLSVNGQRFQIAGIAPRGFHGLEAGHPVDLWVPVEVEPLISTVSVFPDGRTVRGYVEADVGWMRGGVRITPDLSAPAVAAKMTAAARASAPTEELRALTSIALTDRIWVSPWEGNRKRLDAVLTPLRIAGLLTVVLTAACLGSLFLGRTSDRRREFTTRLALGAGRVRILRLTALEMLLVGLAATTLAWTAARAMLAAAGPLLLADGITIANASLAVDARAVLDLVSVAALTFALASLPSILYAAAACRTTRADSSRAAAPGTTLRRVLVAAQVASGCAMLAGAGMLTQSLLTLEQQPLGFDARRVAFVELNPSGAGLSDDERATLVDRVLADPAHGPEIAVADELPFGGESTLFAAAEDASTPDAWALPATSVAGPYFGTLGVSLTAGRAFERRDANRAVVILSAPLAARWWPGRSPLGGIVRIGGVRGTPHEVIGVAEGLRDRSLRTGPSYRLYLPLGRDFERLVLLARSPSPASEAPALVERVRRIDSRLVPVQSGPVDRLVRRSLEQRRALQMISTIVGLGSLVMVAVGVWGLSHGTLRRRWQEFGIRQALGASPRQIGRLAMREAWIVALLGGAAGLAGAWQFGRVLRGWLFGVTPADPWILAAAALVVIGAASAGAIRPVRQAMRGDPAALLRDSG